MTQCPSRSLPDFLPLCPPLLERVLLLVRPLHPDVRRLQRGDQLPVCVGPVLKPQSVSLEGNISDAR